MVPNGILKLRIGLEPFYTSFVGTRNRDCLVSPVLFRLPSTQSSSSYPTQEVVLERRPTDSSLHMGLLVARVKLRGSSSLVWTRRRGSSSLAAGVRARTRELLPGGAGARERLPVTDYRCARKKMEWGLLTDG